MLINHDAPLWEAVASTSFLEYAFLRWVLAPATLPGIRDHVHPQAEVAVNGRK